MSLLGVWVFELNVLQLILDFPSPNLSVKISAQIYLKKRKRRKNLRDPDAGWRIISNGSLRN
jgi:hypothetical protein